MLPTLKVRTFLLLLLLLLVPRFSPLSLSFRAPLVDFVCPMSLTRPRAQAFGVGAIPWSPLGRGVHTRPLAAQTKRSETDVCVPPLPPLRSPPPPFPFPSPLPLPSNFPRIIPDGHSRTKPGRARPTSSPGTSSLPDAGWTERALTGTAQR